MVLPAAFSSTQMRGEARANQTLIFRMLDRRRHPRLPLEIRGIGTPPDSSN
jgi:hypothetical protein